VNALVFMYFFVVEGETGSWLLSKPVLDNLLCALRADFVSRLHMLTRRVIDPPLSFIFTSA
jgi:hypothetical protein